MIACTHSVRIALYLLKGVLNRWAVRLCKVPFRELDRDGRFTDTHEAQNCHLAL